MLGTAKLPAARYDGTAMKRACRFFYLLRVPSCYGTDKLLRCALRLWEMGPCGTATMRHHLLDIKVGAISFADNSLLVLGGRIHALVYM